MEHDERARLIISSNPFREQYDTAKRDFGAQYLGLFGANYEDYLSRRDSYFENIKLDFSSAESLAYYAQSLPEKARIEYFSCVKALSKQSGLWIELINEDEQGATMRVTYNGAANSPNLRIRFSHSGTSTKLPSITLPANGTFDLLMIRENPRATIKVSANGTFFSDTEVSLSPQLKLTATSTPDEPNCPKICDGYQVDVRKEEAEALKAGYVLIYRL